MTHRTLFILAITVGALTMLAGDVSAQGGPGRGRGRSQGQGGPGFRGGRQDPAFQADHEVFQYLLAKGDKIRRNVKNLHNGIETLTESDVPEITVKIQEHVAAMYDRLEEKRPIHLRDPLFRELFQHTEKIELKSELTPKGIRVVETSQDPYVVKLLQAHAKVVSLFIKNGFAEVRRNHPVPDHQRKLGAAVEKNMPAEFACGGKKACCQAEQGTVTAARPNATPGESSTDQSACCRGEVHCAGKAPECDDGKSKLPKTDIHVGTTN